MTRHISIIFWAVLCIGLLSVFFAERRELGGLRAEKAQLLAQSTQPAENTPPQPSLAQPAIIPAVSSELLQLRNQVSQARTRLPELAEVRSESDRLHQQLAATGTKSTGPVGAFAPGYIPRSKAAMVGFNTPEDALQSYLWALQNTNVATLAQAFAAEAFNSLKPPQSPPNTPEEYFGSISQSSMRGDINGIPGVAVTSKQVLPDGTVALTIQTLPEFPPETIRFKQVNGEWKMIELR